MKRAVARTEVRKFARHGRAPMSVVVVRKPRHDRARLPPIVLPMIEESYAITGGRRFVRKTPLQSCQLRTARDVGDLFRAAQRRFPKHEREYD